MEHSAWHHGIRGVDESWKPEEVVVVHQDMIVHWVGEVLNAEEIVQKMTPELHFAYALHWVGQHNYDA